MQHLSRMMIMACLAAGLALTTSGCKDDENPADPGLGGGLSSAAFPNNTANLAPGGAPGVGTITGGTPPYTISTPPNAAVATAALSGTNNATLTITPVAVGNTSVTVEDASTASSDGLSGLQLVIQIVVTEGGGGGSGIAGSGTMTLNTSVGTNFSASGTYDENALSGQGVGGIRYSVNSDGSAAFYRMDLIGYVLRSVTDADLVVMSFQSAENQELGTGNFTLTPMGGAFANVAFGFGINLSDPQATLYTSLSGSATLSALTQTTASVIKVSGDALNPQNPQQTATFSAGAADVTGMGQGDAPFGDTEIEKAVLEFYHRWKAQQDAR